MSYDLYHMKPLILKPISVILILCLLAAVLLSTLSSPVFLLSLFNSMVLAVAVGSCSSSRSSAEDQVDDVGGVWSSFQFSSSYGGAGEDCSGYDAVRNDGGDEEEENDDDMYCQGKYEEGCGSESKDGREEGDENDDEELEYGYDEDDDDDGSEGEVGWDDEGDCEEEEIEEVVEEDGGDDDEDEGMDEVDGGEVVDDNLEKRAEEFITKVTKGWRDELLRDHRTW